MFENKNQLRQWKFNWRILLWSYRVSISDTQWTTSILNLLHSNIIMHILHTCLYIFPKVLTRRICLTIKNLFSCDYFLCSCDPKCLMLVTVMGQRVNKNLEVFKNSIRISKHTPWITDSTVAKSEKWKLFKVNLHY